MLDDFIIRALLGGIAVALAAGPLGSFIVWKKMAFFGDAVAHSSVLGVVIGIIIGLNQSISVAIFALLFALLITALRKQKFLAGDTILGLAAHGALAFGVILQAVVVPGQFNLTSLLFGDILAISYSDIAIMYAGSFIIICGIASIWRPLLLSTINEDIARVEGVNVSKISFLFTLMVALMVALSIKIVGVLMVSALLIVPAATARLFSQTPERMSYLASTFGVLAVCIGIFTSLEFDTPAGPSVVAALLVVLSLVYTLVRKPS